MNTYSGPPDRPQRTAGPWRAALAVLVSRGYSDRRAADLLNEGIWLVCELTDLGCRLSPDPSARHGVDTDPDPPASWWNEGRRQDYRDAACVLLEYARRPAGTLPRLLAEFRGGHWFSPRQVKHWRRVLRIPQPRRPSDAPELRTPGAVPRQHRDRLAAALGWAHLVEGSGIDAAPGGPADSATPPPAPARLTFADAPPPAAPAAPPPAPRPLTPGDLRLITEVDEGGPGTAADLADRLGLAGPSSSTLRDRLARLCRWGVLASSPDPLGGRDRRPGRPVSVFALAPGVRRGHDRTRWEDGIQRREKALRRFAEAVAGGNVADDGED